MTQLFVPLSVNYAEDDKLIDVGPMAELLYVRGLAFAKRARSNGLIRANQLAVVAARIPRYRQLSERLVEVGLWERNGNGWYVSAWHKHNAEMVDVSAIRAAAGSRGAHVRWHIEGRQPKPDCEHCLAENLIDPIANR